MRFTREARLYRFHLCDRAGCFETLERELTSDVEASVITFDLMVEYPRATIEVERSGRVALRRNRAGGKTGLDWL